MAMLSLSHLYLLAPPSLMVGEASGRKRPDSCLEMASSVLAPRQLRQLAQPPALYCHTRGSLRQPIPHPAKLPSVGVDR